MRNLFVLLFIFIPSIVSANEFSEKIDLPQTGWNKVLQVSNGNTFLFHFEPRKMMIVKLFGKDRKEIAGGKVSTKLVDPAALERSELHGIYEIGGQAVVFISQAINNHETLIRLCFDLNTGKLVEEQKVIESSSFKKRISFSLVKNKTGYAVFCMKDLVVNYEDAIELIVFDEKHQKTKEVPVPIKPKDYDYIQHVSTTAQEDGSVAVTLFCRKIIQYPEVTENYISLCYLPDGAGSFSMINSKIPWDIGPYYAGHTYNDFGKKINLWVTNAQTGYIKNGLEKISVIIYMPMMLRYNSNNLSDMSYSYFTHAAANAYLQEQTDTNHIINPVPIVHYTNKFGLNTIVSEENKPNVMHKGVFTQKALVGSVTVTQVNDEGKEVWATILPKKQFVENEVTPNELFQRGQYKKLFRREDPASDWLYQFISFNSVMTPRGTCYVIFNDLPQNFNRSHVTDVDSMYSNGKNNNYYRTNAVCYKITKKHDLTKVKLMEAEQGNMTFIASIEGADYNADLQTYCSLFICPEEGGYVQRLGWRKLDEE